MRPLTFQEQNKMLLDFKKHTLSEYINHAMYHGKKLLHPTKDTLIKGRYDGRPITISSFSIDQRFPEVDVGVYNERVVFKDIDDSVKRSSRFRDITYAKHSNSEVLNCPNCSYFLSINRKNEKIFRSKEYQLLNRRLTIRPKIYEYEHRMKNYSLTERYKRTGEYEKRIRFCTVLYQDGVEINRVYDGIEIFEKYKKNGTCTYTHYDFKHNGSSSYIQMKVHKDGVHLYIGMPGVKGAFQLKPIVLPEIHEAGIEYLYNDEIRFLADLCLSQQLHEILSSGLEQLVHTLMINSDVPLFNNAVQKIRSTEIMEVK